MMGFPPRWMLPEVERKARDLEGAIILSFDCRGCMAEDHQLEWVGQVVGREETRYAGPAVRVKIIKRNGAAGDWRDGDMGESIEPITNSALQQLAPKLFAVYR